VWNNKTVSLSQDWTHKDHNDSEGLDLKERGFEMAFGFLGEQLPPTIGTWNIYYAIQGEKVFDDSDTGFTWT
jgi:hypothetical protein